jgi:aromatic ring-opening dioxygenase catalytic subunit (LigB family)
MLLINPAANIPIVQLSVLSSNSPQQHFAMGKALASLRESGVAIVGSGMPSFHNLRTMFSGGMNGKEFKRINTEFSNTLTNTVEIQDSAERGKKFEGWRDWVGAKEAHTTYGVEHFLPLIVCAGAAGEEKAESFADEMMGIKQYSYYWK